MCETAAEMRADSALPPLQTSLNAGTLELSDPDAIVALRDLLRSVDYSVESIRTALATEGPFMRDPLELPFYLKVLRANEWETGIEEAGETGRAVEPQCVRVGRHFQALCAPCSQHVRDAGDERSGNPAPHPARVHEQVFQLHGAADVDPGGEAHKRAALFRDMGAALG